MGEIQYKRLDAPCFNAHSLDSFVRHQDVTECCREVDNKWVLVPNPFIENWSAFRFQRNIGTGALEGSFLQWHVERLYSLEQINCTYRVIPQKNHRQYYRSGVLLLVMATGVWIDRKFYSKGIIRDADPEEQTN